MQQKLDTLPDELHNVGTTAQPEIVCHPYENLGYPAMWVVGGGIRGEAIESIYRVDETGEHEIRGGGVTGLVDERTYTDLLYYEADGTTPAPNNTYQHVIDTYADYSAILQGKSYTSKRFVAVDIEAPYNENFHYRVVIRNGPIDPANPHDPTNYTTYRSSPCQFPYAPSQFLTDIPCSPVVLTDPLVIEEGTWVGLLGIDPLSYPGRRELFDVLGRVYPVPYSQVRQAPRTTIRLITRTLLERRELLGLLSSGRVLLMRNPDVTMDNQQGRVVSSYPENNWYISIGDVVESRIFTDHRRPERRWELEIAVVDRPSGYLSAVGSSDRVFNTVRDFAPDGETPRQMTFAEVRAEYRNFFDVEIGHGAFNPQLSALTYRPLAYGEGIYPTEEAAETSWSLI